MKLFEKYYRLIYVFVIINLFFAMVFTYMTPPGSGDELEFIKEISLIKEFGWNLAVKNGISIPYMLVVYPLTFIIDDYLALRVVNLLILFGVLFYFYSLRMNKKFYILFFFLLCTARYYFMGTNDVLFFSAVLIFLIEGFYVLNNNKKNLTIMWLCFFVALFTRALFFVYLPLFLILLFVIYKNKKELYFNPFYVSTLVFFMLLLNAPSLLSGAKLSFDNKLPPKGVESNWIQRQYLAQLLVNENKIKNGTHPTWEETDEYLKINGKESLPDTTFKNVFFDIKLTIKEFFKDFWSVYLYGFRQIGFLIFLPFMVIYFRKKTNNLLLPLLTLIPIGILSIIIISYLELRWLFPILVFYCFLFSKIVEENSFFTRIFNLNLVVIFVFSIYGTIRIITNLI